MVEGRGHWDVLRHGYEVIAADVIWKLAQIDLPVLDKACREDAESARQQRR